MGRERSFPAVLDERITGGRMVHIVGIEDPSALDPQVVGRKFAALARAARGGFGVPSAVVIATRAHAHFRATGGWPEGLREEVLAAARRLSAPRGVSIRSSATREDLAGQSFAGQYRSFLEVDGDGEVLRRVEECWESGGSDTVRSYLQAMNMQGADAETPLLAVIIQRMVDSAVAGVAFSRHPLYPGRGEMVIEAVRGHAEGLVSGRRSPCRAQVHRDGRLSVESGAPSFRRLSRQTPWGRIAALLGRLEESYGGQALDIEWAVDHGRALWLLQVRPMTTPAPADGPPPTGTWTRRIADDLWADRLEPFMAEVMLRHAPRFDLSRISRLVGIPAVQPALTVINGYLYVNCDSIRRVIAHLPPVLRLESLAELLPAGARLSAMAPPPVWTLMRLGLGVLRLPLQEPGMIPWICLRNARPAIRRLRARLRPDAAAGGRLERLQADLESLARIQENNQWPYFHATFCTWALRWLAVDRLGMDGAGFLAMLSRGAENVTIGIERWFRDTARRIAADPDLKARFLAEPATRLAASLPAGLQTELDAFLQRNGFRSRHRTLLLRRWAEAPEEVLGILRSLVRHPGAAGPDPSCAAAAVRAKPPGGLARHALKLLAGLTRRFLDLREELRFLLDEALFRIRLDLLDLGRAYGLGEAVFFLKPQEIEALVSGRLDAREAGSLSAQRRRRFETPFDPGVFYVEGRPEFDFSAGGTVLHGIGTSPGRVCGRAVIVDEPAAAGIRRGDVVIARHTDPGWTPIFSLIGGIVTEEGGLLNHCAIVARELGVPAIVGVRRATRLIPDGARVTIDGGAGLVRIEAG
jgi:pyruvate,water dikinase